MHRWGINKNLLLFLIFSCRIFLLFLVKHYPANIFLFEVNNRNTRERCEVCSKLTIKTQERRQWTYFTPFSNVSIVELEQANISWVIVKVISNEEPNELTIYAKLCQNVTTFHRQEREGIENKTFQVTILLLMTVI